MSIRTFLMTVIAWNYRVSAQQWESRISMHRDRKFRPVKIVYRMTVFTKVLVGSLCELPVMGVLVTIHALRKFDFENRIRPGGYMALAALHACVLAQERIRGCSMFLHAEQGRRPPAHRVTLRAFPFTRTSLELPLVRIGIVAIHALRVRHPCLEIRARVTT